MLVRTQRRYTPVIVEAHYEADANDTGGSHHVVDVLQRFLMEDAHRVLDGLPAGRIAIIGAEDAHHLDGCSALSILGAYTKCFRNHLRMCPVEPVATDTSGRGLY